VIPTAANDTTRITAELKIAQRELASLEVLAASILREVEAEREQIESVDRRIHSLSVDLKNYQDVRRLKQIGANVSLSIVNGRCPTCEQTIEDALVPQGGSSAMTLAGC
jgi:predicted  nucleic acid-binding Zn-ribbon protein